jgi:hypothetical protein
MKNKILIALLCLAILVTGGGIVFKYKHKIKTAALKAVKVAHNLLKKNDAPARYNAVPPAAANGIAVFAASSLDRIFQDGKTLLKPSFSPAAAISMAKNEYESFQVVVQPQAAGLEAVKLEISDLVNVKNGAKIGKENISWRVVGYVPTQEPYYPVKYVGLWPDPLLPARPTDIQAGKTQPFWVTVYSSPQTAPGTYEGRIEVTADNKGIKTLLVSVQVYDFSLPQSSHLKTAFDFYGHITKLRYPQGDLENDNAYTARLGEVNDKFITMMLSYRMNPILNIDPSVEQELSSIDRYLVLGLNNFSIGKKGGTFNNNWPEGKASVDGLFSLYRGYGEDLKLNNMLQYTYIYAWDEGEMGNPRVSRVCGMIHRAYPGLKTMVCYHGIWDTAYGKDWIKDIDIWTFQMDSFDEQKMRKLQAMGKEIWMYVSGPAGADTPNLVMDFDSIDYRILPWLCWKYNIKGFLYWCVNWWPLVDPFENAKNSQWEQNGNGLLFYPGKDGPIASIRTELFRDGMEDYEYIQVLFDRLKVLKQKHLDGIYSKYFSDSIKLLTVDDSIASSMSGFTKDGGVLNARRKAIARKIEEFDLLPVH